MSNNERSLGLPFFQVKSGGHVIDHVSSQEAADRAYRDAAAYPAEIWKISEGGHAQLMRRKTGS